jgi:acetyltransferase
MATTCSAKNAPMDPFGQSRHALDMFFTPRNVAVIGASERPGSVGRTLMWNLLQNPFGGTIFPVNEKREQVLGVTCWKSVASLPQPMDLAVVLTPAPAVPGVIRECAKAGVRGAIVISAGFKEIGAAGVQLEQEILAIARESKMRIVGPNCLGVMCPPSGLNATFAGAMARKGSVAFLSQSGALQTAILDWSLQANVGFSAFVSLGSMLDVGWGDLIDYLDNDGKTKSILVYMESIGDAHAFLSAAREVALRKPIIVLKAGRTEQAAHAAASHTGSMAGSDEALTAAFRRSGVLRVDSIADLFYMADVLAKQPRPRGNRLCIVTNAGGPAVLATDALIAGGGALSAVSPEGMAKLSTVLPAQWSHANPIDILGDAGADRFEKTLTAAAAEQESDANLVILTPQQMTDATLTAKALAAFAKEHPEKPLLASWMGGAGVEEGRRILAEANIPCFGYPDTAARIFNYMWKYSYNLRGLYETPALAEEQGGGREAVAAIVREARARGRTLLTELEAKRVIAAYGIPTVETRLAESAGDAIREATLIGYPVVLKLHSLTVTHKSDIGGVQLDLRDALEVSRAFDAIRAGAGEAFAGVTVQPMIRESGTELIIGSTVDAQFGPVLLFGAGGTLAEILDDRSLALPPLNTTLARRMMERTKIHRILSGARGRPPVDLAALEKLLVRFSRLVVEQPAIREIDLNPLRASADQLVVLDARIILHGKDVPDEKLPAPAIRPYPVQYIGTAQLRSGEVLNVRPIRPEDEPRMVRFHDTLSEQSVFYRYAGFVKLDTRVQHERLSRLCFIDYDREMALVAERAGEIVAVARLVRLRATNDAEFALVISDSVQRQGLGHVLLKRLFDVGRDWGLSRIVAEIAQDNLAMRRVCDQLGFQFQSRTEAFKDLTI